MTQARVLICDDSAVIRAAIAGILKDEPKIEVVARAANGKAAIDALRLHDVDVALLDIEMPVMDGLTALPLMLAASPGLAVIMASSLTTRGADISLRALQLGAADTLAKPSTTGLVQDQRFGLELVAKVMGLARMRRRAAPVLSKLALRPPPALPPRVLAIGSSTGGPNALFTLVQGLSPRLGVPVVITQHMPASFLPTLAEHIGRLGALPCALATDGAALLPGHILLAPGDRHMLVRQSGAGLVAALSDSPPEQFCRPAVDPMLRSLTEATSGRVLAAILTGMGSDGLAGARLLVEAGGGVVAQDEATSVVWGMPGAIARAGLACAVLPLDDIAPRLNTLLGGRR